MDLHPQNPPRSPATAGGASVAMDVYLVRHGETAWNREGRAQGRGDIPLNETGWSQAAALGRHFQDVDLAAIYSSPAKRASETAQAIAAPHELTPELRDGLLELDLGELDGTRLREMRDRFPDFFQNWTTNAGTARFPSGETLEELQERAWGVISSIINAHETQQSIVVVSHAFATYAILCRAMGLPLANYSRLRQDPARISCLVWQGAPGGPPDGGRWTLTGLNDGHHLASLAP